MGKVWPQLAAIDLRGALFVLTDADIRAYDWDQQDIWLNDRGIERVASPEVNALFTGAFGRAFVVTFQGERLYGGLVYPAYHPPALRFPVIHVFGTPIEFLRIRPGLCEPWAPTLPHLAARCQLIANPGLKAWLATRNLLGPIPPERRPPEPEW